MAEDDIVVRKKLCDILHRERIIAVGSTKRALEALVQHKGKLNLIIANARVLRGITSKDIIDRLCKKIEVEVPPMVGIYRKGEERIVKKIIEGRNDQKFVKYDEKDENFPKKYVQTIKTQYSDLLVDDEHLDKDWTVSDAKQDMEDIRTWLSEEGLVEKSLIADEEKKTVEMPENGEGVDYKKLYFEVKEKYDELLRYIHELTE